MKGNKIPFIWFSKNRILLRGNKRGVKYEWPRMTQHIDRTRIPFKTSRSLFLGWGVNKSFEMFQSIENDRRSLPRWDFDFTSSSSLDPSIAPPQREVCCTIKPSKAKKQKIPIKMYPRIANVLVCPISGWEGLVRIKNDYVEFVYSQIISVKSIFNAGTSSKHYSGRHKPRKTGKGYPPSPTETVK